MYLTLIVIGQYLLKLIGGFGQRALLLNIYQIGLINMLLLTLPSFNLYDNLIMYNSERIISILGLIILFILILYWNTILISRESKPINLYIILLLTSLTLMILSQDLLLTFILIELSSFILYLLIANYSNGIKYFLLSSLTTTLFLLGILIIYADLGTTHYDLIDTSQATLFSLFFIFKLGLVPFHQLTADLYESLPLSIMVLYQIPIKYSFLILSLNFKLVGLEGIIYFLGLFLILIPAILSIYQFTMKRFLAISSLSYLGLLFLLGLLGSNSEDIILYLFIYSISLLLVLYNKNPYLISLILFSISGMPPFAGFYTNYIFYKIY